MSTRMLMPCPKCFSEGQLHFVKTEALYDDDIIVRCTHCDYEGGRTATPDRMQRDWDQAADRWNQESWQTIGAVLKRLSQFLDAQE